DLNQYTHTVGWADTPLMRLCQHGLKENIQHIMVMSNVERVRKLKEFNKATKPPIVHSTSTSTPAPNPNAMDLSAFQKAPGNRLSNAKQACWVQRNLCFCCGQAGHISCGCLNGALQTSGGNQSSLHQPKRQ
ncbi:uncharacterized protein VP01_2765g1, partial [Puccinia sorghi]